MDAIASSGAPVSTQMYVMKKSEEIDSKAVSSLLNTASVQKSSMQDAKLQESTAQKTGLGQSLDLLA
ncbi:hypothetical protein KKA17_10255 [bacterium]|nr:hypothetical protein [bacterium]MBU1884384.1 hypothetical protein [bacterium]